MWQAGQRLMQAGNPEAFTGVLAGNRLMIANRDALEARYMRLHEARAAVRCTIEVGADR